MNDYTDALREASLIQIAEYAKNDSTGEMNNCIFRIENIAFQSGARAGARLLRELLQINC